MPSSRSILGTNLVKVFAKNIPKIGPLEPNARHIVVGDLDKLLQAEHPRMLRKAGGLNFLPRYVAKCLDEVNNCSLS
jgi:hypothetical protein